MYYLLGRYASNEFYMKKCKIKFYMKKKPIQSHNFCMKFIWTEVDINCMKNYFLKYRIFVSHEAYMYSNLHLYIDPGEKKRQLH